MADMNGKRVLVTGGTAGIGKQTGLELAKLGAEVVIVGRNAEKTAAVVEWLRQESGATIDSFLADLSSMASIRAFATAFLGKYDRLDVLVNNAGALFPKREVTVDGWERTFATNHLSYFLVTHLLLPALERAERARIVNVSSAAHAAAPLDFDDLMAERSRYRAFRQYGRSKLANIFFTRELARRVAGKQITVNCLHPGFVASEFLAKGGIWTIIRPIGALFAVDVVAGAKTSVYLASSPEVAGVSGKYFDKCKEKQPNKIADNDAAATRLWQVSAQLCGI
ncbi:MAG TPA: SDR family oxidoreductase [Polyangia bacterium]|nr:SDR family oxidoreductase [Polyangia bacterium]